MKLSLQIQWKNYMIIQNTRFPFKKRMFPFLGEKKISDPTLGRLQQWFMGFYWPIGYLFRQNEFSIDWMYLLIELIFGMECKDGEGEVKRNVSPLPPRKAWE